MMSVFGSDAARDVMKGTARTVHGARNGARAARKCKIVHFTGLLCGGHFSVYKVSAADSRCWQGVLLASG